MIGVDFWMNADRGYSFPQGIDHKRPKDGSRPQWDNRQYEVVDNWLCRMQKSGVFERFGIEFYNCFQSSGLRAFPYVPFETAVKLCQGIVEDAPDLVGWYEK